MNSQSALSQTSSQNKNFDSCYELYDHRNHEEVLSAKESSDEESLDDNEKTGSPKKRNQLPCSPHTIAFEPILQPYNYSQHNSSNLKTGYEMNRSQSYDSPEFTFPAKDENTSFLHHKKAKSCTHSLLRFAFPDKKTDCKIRENSTSQIEGGFKDEVCLPAPQYTERKNGIDFSELERFADIDRAIDHCSRNYYRPAVRYFATSTRPLVPQAMVLDPTREGQEYRSTGDDQNDEKLRPDHSISSTLDSWDEQEACESSKSPKDNSCNHDKRISFTMDRFTFFATDSEATIHSPDVSSLLAEDKTFEDLFNTSNGTWWLDCLDPTDAELMSLAKAFSIHPLTVEDISTRETRQKVELFKKYYFVSFHTFDSDSESETFLEPINVYIVVFRAGILSFHFSPISHACNVRRRIRQLRDYVRVSSDWICYAIIDDITDGFKPVIREIEVETDVIEDSVFIAREADFTPILRRIGIARQRVMILLRLLSGKADVIKMFAKRCNEQYSNAPRLEIGLYLSDVQDHIISMHQNLSVYEKVFSRSHGNYLAQLQVESVNSNNRITKVLGRVTLIGTILVPLNLVTGLFGMNVRVPGQGGDDLKWFFGIIGFISVVIIMFSLIATKWLGDAESGNEDSHSSNPSQSRIQSGVIRNGMDWPSRGKENKAKSN